MIENLTVAELSSWLASQPENTTETPYEINLTDVTNTNITYIKSYLQANPTKYVNLSPTYITNYSMSLSYLFENCMTLIESPRFMTPTYGLHPSLYAAFRGCTNLKYGYVLSGTQDASRAFQGCTSLISFPGGTPSSLRDVSYFCDGCTSLQAMPYLSDVTNMEGAFRNCTSLTSITNIPSSVRNMTSAYKGCTGITSAPDIPYGITSLESTFEGCTALEECGSIANSVTNFTNTFKGCSSMTSFPDISSNGSIGLMEGTFEGCTGITTFSFPLSVRNIKNCFKGVTSLETVNNVPSGITNAESCFEGCTSLTTINLFSIPLDTLKNNANFKDMFKGCTSLTSIGSAVEEADDWHIFYFKVVAYPTYGGINGRVYDKEGNYNEISYYNYSDNINMIFFQFTDELWFPRPLMTDAEVISVIEKVIAKKVSYFNKEVVDPEKKTFIMYADDPEEVHTNLKLGGGITVYDTEEELEEDLPNLSDGDIVATYGDGEPIFNDAPLGSVMSYLGTTDPSDGKWLICDGRDTTGTAIELETHYPNLYMFLGGTNVLPEIFDHTRLSNFEIIRQGGGTSTGTCEYDGYFYLNGRRNSGAGIIYSATITDSSGVSRRMIGEYDGGRQESITIPVKEGDTYSITVDQNGSDTSNPFIAARWYKNHCVIKATSSVDYYHLPSTEIAQIEQYFDNGINTIKNNGLSYNTTETWTGGYWIDGKPIYRKVYDMGSYVSNLNIDVTSLNIDTIIDIGIIANDSTDGTRSKWTYSSTSGRNAYIENNHLITSGNQYKRFAILTYTKTTD